MCPQGQLRKTLRTLRTFDFMDYPSQYFYHTTIYGCEVTINLISLINLIGLSDIRKLDIGYFLDIRN